MAQTFDEFRDMKSNARRGQLSTLFLASFCVAAAIMIGIMIVCVVLSPEFMVVFPLCAIAFAALVLIPSLLVGIKIGFDFLSDHISYHFSKDNKESAVKIEPSYSKATEVLNTTHLTNKVEKSPSLIERFNKTTVGMKIQYVLSFIDGTSKEKREAMAQRNLDEFKDKMFDLYS